MISNEEIIKYYFRTSKGIKGIAGYLGISKIRVGKVITLYKKKHQIKN